MSTEPTFDSPLDDAMQEAIERAQATFGYFWRERHWELRRIVPGLSLACVKAAFSDPEDPDRVEQMWLDDVWFDGHSVFGVLLNRPNTLTSVTQGEPVQLPLERITDWMVVFDGTVYGAFTVQQQRARMSEADRAHHDGLWGLPFGDPAVVALPHEGVEHPMSENMGPALAEHLQEHPDDAVAVDPQGSTMLHAMVLGGSLACTEVLLAHGADPEARNLHGDTPRDLAMLLGWDRLSTLLDPEIEP